MSFRRDWCLRLWQSNRWQLSCWISCFHRIRGTSRFLLRRVSWRELVDILHRFLDFPSLKQLPSYPYAPPSSSKVKKLVLILLDSNPFTSWIKACLKGDLLRSHRQITFGGLHLKDWLANNLCHHQLHKEFFEMEDMSMLHFMIESTVILWCVLAPIPTALTNAMIL